MPALTYYLSLTFLTLAYYAPLASTTGVILPLYTWPSDSAWDPVYNALAAYPDVEFYVIVNPNSGPGDSSPPASEYIAGVTALNSYPNVHTLGYVRTNYTNRDIHDVKEDIDIYSQWASYSASTRTRTLKPRSACSDENTSTATPSIPSTPSNPNPGIALSGIFFDEAPHSSSTPELSYMQDVAAYVQSKPANFNFNSNSSSATPTVIFNPGTTHAPEYFNYATHIVDFESPYSVWQERNSGGAGFAVDGVDSGDYSQSAIIINSVPEDVDYGSVIDAVVEKGIALMYLTNDFDYKRTDSVGKVAAAIVGA
ncbi:Spherulation-specific family 4 [Aspergillus granulosus]|uniref:Spherulation-specific family 4 n=1 Tax=Aspergillus granulosus TaxID=176169 RepID=A0ABR4HXQ1_9EURO